MPGVVGSPFLGHSRVTAMSLINNLLALGETTLLQCGHGDVFTIINGVNGDQTNSGKTFTARLDVEQVIEWDGPTGSDRRMQSVVRIAKPAPFVFDRGSLFKCNGKTYSVVNVENNDASITVDYYVEQQL